jgi:energy-coupling factor transport system ATP-binding protein
MIEVQHISYDYEEPTGRRRVLSDISLVFRPGEAIAIMGANGSGKSTLVKCLNGLLLPTGGKVTVAGLSTADADHLPAIRRQVGMIFQNPDNQIVSATVEREIAFGLENLGLDYETMHQRVQEMLQRLNLAHLRQKSPHHLSGGEKQRLAMAAVLAMQPRYLILDEPTSLLDPRSREEILSHVNQLHTHPANGDRENMTTILVTQFAEEALTADRLIVVGSGRIVFDAPPAEIFTRVDELSSLGLEPPAEFILQRLLRG